MIEEKGSLREQMMRCYLLGYITTRHNDYKIVSENLEYNTYKDLRQEIAIETLMVYGMNKKIASFIVKYIAPFERFVSILLCVKEFIFSVFKFCFTNKQIYRNKKFYPKLNYQESRILNMWKSAGLTENDFTVIDIPQQATKYIEIPSVSVYSGITFNQLCKSFVYSIRLCWFMISKYRKNDSIFRVHSCYSYFLCFFFVANLDESNELIFCNHYDRWMYLFGNFRLHKTYIQHGKLWIDYIKRINCDVAYYLSKSQQTILEHTLWSNKPEARFRKIFEYSGQDKIKSNGGKNLLIVCYESYTSKHEAVVKAIYDKNVNIYLKPHPNDNFEIYQKFKKMYPDIVVLEKFDYPKVDVVISYDSTLADEYEMHDITVIRYENSDYEKQLNNIG